jgi:hypothetical protein
MEIKNLNKNNTLEQDKKLNKLYVSFEKLLDELKRREIPSELVHSINLQIDEINSFSGQNRGLRKQIRKSRSKVLKLIEKELQLVTKNHYRNTFMVLGMAFGVAIGTALGTSNENTSFLSVGIGIGMVLGLGIGSAKDKKAKENGLQLDLEIK